MFSFPGVSAGGYTPVIIVTVNGAPAAAGFYSRLIKATVRDEAGQKSDTLTVELDDADNAIALPPPKAKISCQLGYKETGVVDVGVFILQSTKLSTKAGDGGGEFMTLQATAADLKTKLKADGHEKFEDTTVGAIVKTIAGRAGMQAMVDGEIANEQIEYRLRNGESEIEFLTALADQFDAVAKPMGDKLVFAKRGNAKSVSGKAIAPIVIVKSECEESEFTPQGRPEYGKTRAPWIDQKTGKRMFEDAPTGLEGPDFILREPLPNKGQAKKAAQSEARRLTRDTGEGSFTVVGRPEAQAEADVILIGFRDGYETPCRAHAVEHSFDANGFRTKIEVKSKEDGSAKKKK